MATADGTVMYVSTKPALSNYGKYIVIRHIVEGLEIYSLYAHLSEVQPGMAAGKTSRPAKSSPRWAAPRTRANTSARNARMSISS